MNEIKKKLDDKCAAVKDMKGSRLAIFIVFIRDWIEAEPKFKPMEPHSLKTVLNSMEKTMKESDDINICSKDGAQELQGRIVPPIAVHFFEMKANYDKHCPKYKAYLESQRGKEFMQGMDKKVKEM